MKGPAATLTGVHDLPAVPQRHPNASRLIEHHPDVLAIQMRLEEDLSNNTRVVEERS